MSGHSKWATIKRKKGAADQKRGAMFSRLAKEIVVAAKHGGGNPDGNVRLRAAIDRAKAASMPGDNIEKAILRGTGQLPGVVYEEVTYEGYGPGGIAVIIECLTDNRNRTTASLRHIFTKSNGNLGEHGSVSYLFTRQGVITVDRSVIGEDALIEAALNAGAEDVETQEDVYQVKTSAGQLHDVAEALKKAGVAVVSSEAAMIPAAWVTPDDVSAGRSAMRLLEQLDEDDDVQSVHSNFEPSAELLAES